MNDLAKVNTIFENEVGYLEKSKTAYKANPSVLDSKTDGAGKDNYTKYWRDIEPSFQGSAWCLDFIVWCFVKAYGKDNAKKMLCMTSGFTYYTPTAYNYFKLQDRAFKNPSVGDIIFFKNTQRICHVGFVYKVDNNYVYTIEGNTSAQSGVIANGGGVSKKKYALSYSRIAGYGRPLYEGENTTPTYPTNNKLVAPKPTLKKGSKGSEVANLQKILNNLVKSNLAVDGDFGNLTFNAVKKLQKTLGFTGKGIDGIYGPNTYNRLKNVIG